MNVWKRSQTMLLATLIIIINFFITTGARGGAVGRGHAGGQLVETVRYKAGDRGFDSRWCHWDLSLTQSFRPHYGPGVDSASNRNEYQVYILGVKAAGVYGWQPYHLHVPTVLNSSSLNLLEPSGSVQACNGIALPFFITTHELDV